jgi:N5-hydroxyornithine acetyltransferase
MAPSILYLPNGQSFTVTPVFGGLFFKSNDLNLHNSVFPAGWTIVIHSEDYTDEPDNGTLGDNGSAPKRRFNVHRYKQPTLQNDSMFISSISNPSSSDFQPAASPTRQIAMMLWTTLYWYFHQPQPPLYLTTEASKKTPNEGKPRGEWRIYIKREGIFRGRNLLPKLERMGLIASEDSAVGSSTDDRSTEGWIEMFVSRRTFWQLSPRLFLFTLTPMSGTPFPGSPYSSRPSSPVRNNEQSGTSPHRPELTGRAATSPGLWMPQTPGPFASGSHLPTYYPPPPPQYIMTNGVRHPIRPKPPRQGETFYLRHIPSVGQYLSFRVASLNDRVVAYTGPVSGYSTGMAASLAIPSHVIPSSSTTDVTSTSKPGSKPGSRPSSRPSSRSGTPNSVESDTTAMTDLQLLHKWMNVPRISKFWGCAGSISNQEAFLKTNLESRHSFPVIGCWDGKPFGYFEIYWVVEDILGKHLSPGDVGDWDRGVRVLVGEDEFRGAHRVHCWLSSLAHWAITSDYRMNSFVLEPRIDNERYAVTHHALYLYPRY